MKKKGFTLIELMIVVAIIAVIAAIAIPNLIASKIASNEATAIASLKVISNAQAMFNKTDFYETGSLVYANEDDGVGIADLYQVGYDGSNADDTAHKTLEKTVASADNSCTAPVAKGGYLMGDLEYDDYTIEYGATAYPFKHNTTGRNVFLIDVTGTVYKIDASNSNFGGSVDADTKAVTPITEYPDSTTLENWIPAGQ